MPLAGGTSEKYGSRFEDRWTAHVAFDVLRERAQWIQVEPPGADLGIEFRVQYADRLEYHQVKRQKTGDAEWSIASLNQAGVLKTFLERLRDPHVHCVFASAYSVGVLDELIDRARKGPWAEFKHNYLSTIRWRTAFDELCRAWGNVNEELAFDALTRMRVEPIGESLLKYMNTVEAETILEGDLSGAVPVLIELLRDSVNMKLTAFDLWAALEPLGYAPSPWRGSPRLVAQISEVNRLYRSTREGALILGKLLKRTETTYLHEAVERHRVVLVTGVAGSGKSGVLLQFTDELKERRVPYLAVRLDSVTPTLRAELLGHELGLAMSPPTALAVVAQGKPAVLVIDQLDVVSATSGRNVQFFDCLHELLGLALTCENIRVVLACRSFDLENDARLRNLAKRFSNNIPVSVGLLTPVQIHTILDELGYSTASLTDAQAQILGIPLHLALLAETARSTSERSLDFRTAHDLYVEFWRCKLREVGEVCESPDGWMTVMYKVVDYMSEHEVLRAPRTVVDERASVAAAMASAHVLIRDGNHYTFFHETFFDYAFARCFSARSYTLQTLLEGDQFLFRRAQVRQILTHEREDNPQQYIRDLHHVLTDPSVRFHIQDSVVSWLAHVAPNDGEWHELASILHDRKAPLSEQAWTTLQSAAWFRMADQHGAIEAWLRADSADTETCVWVLSAVCSAEPERVADLLRPYAASSGNWPRRIIFVLSRASLWRSRSLFDLCVDMLKRGAFEPASERTVGIWDVAADLSKTQPEWTCELLGHYLHNRLEAAIVANVRNLFDSPEIIPHHLHVHGFITDASTQAPAEFVHHVWPSVVAIVQRLVRTEIPGRPLIDDAWHLRHFSQTQTGFEHQLLAGLETAFSKLAHDQPNLFERIAWEQIDTSFDTVAYLLFQGFAANASLFAELAVKFLLRDERRFQISYSDDTNWGTHKLLEAISPHLSREMLELLVERILDYYPPDERTKSGLRYSGYAQFSLLDGIQRSCLSRSAEQRLLELQRKFGAVRPRGPYGIRGGFVESPIPASAAAKMTDEQWLKATACYSSDDRDQRNFLKGGASELARVLEAETSQNPVRFARLASSMPDHTNVSYFAAVLRGLSASRQQVPIELIGTLLERCHRLPGRPCGRWIGDPLRAHAKSGVPEHLLDIIAWYAQHDPDPRNEEERGTTNDHVLSSGINTVRGAIADDIATLVDRKAEHVAPLRAAVDALVTDRVPAVRAIAAEVVCALVQHDSKRALDLFLSLIDGMDDWIFTTHGVDVFLAHRANVDFERLRPVIERMLSSAYTEVRKDGATHATRVSLTTDAATDLVESCVHGMTEHRLGVAHVYAANLASTQFRALCEANLARFFDDASTEVRATAAAAIHWLSGSELGEFQDLADRFFASQAFEENANALLHALQETTARVPCLALNVCDRVMAKLGPDATDASMTALRYGPDVATILMRAYVDSRDRAERGRALDLIDRALRLNVFGAAKAVAGFDRTWSSN